MISFSLFSFGIIIIDSNNIFVLEIFFFLEEELISFKKYDVERNYEGQSISNASYFFFLYSSRKLKYNYIA